MQNISKIAIESYRQLHDGLSEMIEGGRLTAAAIPDDYHWLTDMLATIAGLDPTAPAGPARPDAPKGLSAASAADDPHLIISRYVCPACGDHWNFVWDSVIDQCCTCGKTVSPTDSEDFSYCQCTACKTDHTEILPSETGDYSEL